MAANQYTTERVRRLAVMPKIDRCYVCNELAKPSGFGVHRGESFMICLSCMVRYDGPVKQAERYGHRFRFIERREIPHQDELQINERSVGFAPNRTYREVYKILLLVREQLEIRQKEVNWSVDERTKRILKLPEQIATIVAKSFAVRGDDATVSDDQALVRIRDLLEAIDEKIIDRNKNKRLP